jgi:hypothetical protein
MRWPVVLIVLAFLLGARTTFGEEHTAHVPPGHLVAHPAEAEDYPHPQAPEASAWPGAMLLTVFFMFLAAAVIGPVVRAHTPEEVPPAHSHDEPPGASHHHGAGGTHVVDPHD